MLNATHARYSTCGLQQHYALLKQALPTSSKYNRLALCLRKASVGLDLFQLMLLPFEQA